MHLVGALPEALGNITKMGGKIEFRDDSLLTGAVPSFLWRWTDVERFQVKFSGYTSIDTDGLDGMVNLTEFNTEGTPIAGTVPGVIFALPAVEKLYFHDSEYDDLPAELTSTRGLTRLYLNGNKLTSLPDMSGMTWGDGAKVRVHTNYLTFEDLEPNMPLTMDTLVAEFNYSPQANVGMAQTIELMTGDTLNLSVDVGGSANMTEATYTKEGVAVADALLYKVLVQSSLVPGLDIFSEVFTVKVDGVLGIEEQQFDGLKVYGNPVGHTLRMEADEPIESLQIFDVTGKLMQQQVVKNTFLSVSRSTSYWNLFRCTTS